uniref:Uncharacterized protein n=1 Tax=Oryza rufipogon TaxID=4529 RepID=A0A0E0NT01_ORYRU
MSSHHDTCSVLVPLELAMGIWDANGNSVGRDRERRDLSCRGARRQRPQTRASRAAEKASTQICNGWVRRS